MRKQMLFLYHKIFALRAECVCKNNKKFYYTRTRGKKIYKMKGI